MTSQRDLEFLLSNKYDPADDTPSRFCQAYNQLAKYRDDLRNQCNSKEQTRAKIKQGEGQCLDRNLPLNYFELIFM